MSNESSMRARGGRALHLLDALAGLLIAGSAGVWLTSWNLAQSTSADSLFLPTLFQDVQAQGLGALKTWHYGSSSFAVPDVFLFAVVWTLFPHFKLAIPAYAGAITATTAAALWLVLKPPRRASFAAFSATFYLLTALYLALMGVEIKYVLFGWIRFAVLSAHHYGNIVNTLLALAVFLWWRSAPSPRRLGALALVVFGGVASDVLLVFTFVPAALIVDVWLRDSTLLQYVRKRWSLPASFALAATLAITGDTLLNPLSPLRAPGGAKLSAFTAFRNFVDVRFGTRPQVIESAAIVAFIVVGVVVALRARRAARRNDQTPEAREAHQRRAAIHSFFVLAIGCNVGATIATGKYSGFEVDRYVLTLVFFPLFIGFGLAAVRLAEAFPRPGLSTVGLALAGLVSLWIAKGRARFDLVAPPYVACIQRLGLDGSAGLVSYWLAKPLLMFTDRRVQVIQINADGRLYTNLVNDRWAAQDWFGGGTTPQLRFALMAADEEHGRMVDGSVPFANDGVTLDPSRIRRAYGPPDAVARCNGATFWTYRAGQLVGLEPTPAGGLVTLPLRLRASRPEFALGRAIEDNDGIRATGEDGNVLYGPYLTLPAGRYGARWSGRRLDARGKIAFDVFVVGNPVPLAQALVDLGEIAASQHELVTLHFVLNTLTSGIETRVFGQGGAQFSLEELVIDHE